MAEFPIHQACDTLLQWWTDGESNPSNAVGACPGMGARAPGQDPNYLTDVVEVRVAETLRKG